MLSPDPLISVSPAYITVEAYVLVRVRSGEEELVDYLRRQPHVVEAKIVYGEYDVVVKARVKDIKELSRLVLEEIRKRFDVERTSTLIVVRESE